MTLGRRLSVVGLLAVLCLGAYAAARSYSTPLITIVVEQALLQKSPAGVDPSAVRGRFRVFVAAASSRGNLLEELLSLSHYLERTQQLSPAELERILKENGKVVEPQRF